MEPIGLDPVTAFLLHEDEHEETRVSEEFKNAPPVWDATTPPNWAASCWGGDGHDVVTCPACQHAMEQWLDTVEQPLDADAEEPTAA